MHLVKTLKLLAILFFISSSTFAQTESEFEELLAKGVKEYNNGNSSKALEFFIRAEVIAKKQQKKDQLFRARNNIGLMYTYFSNYGEALGYYLKAFEDVDNVTGIEEDKIKLLSNIGLLYSLENDKKTALEYYTKAYQYSAKVNNERSKVLIAINISDLHNKLGQHEKAISYLLEVQNIPTSKRFEQSWKCNYAESLMLSGKLLEAQVILERLISEIDPLQNQDVYVQFSLLISDLYEKQNKINKAIFFGKKGLKSNAGIERKIELYNQLGDLYFKNRKYETFKQYTDSLIIAKDSLAAVVNRGLFESNKVKLKVQEYQNELETKSERNRIERIFFVVGILLALLVFYIIYRGLKHRIAKQRQEKINADNEKKIYELELDNLKNSVAEKNRKLSAKALYLSGRNELIDDVITSLSAIPEVSNKKEVSDYIRTLRAYIKTDEEWDDFITYFEQVNPEFIKTLTNKFPDINTADIRFLCYVYMNLDVREIGNIYNITYNAAVKRLRRIREKMQIDKDMSLHEYLVSLS